MALSADQARLLATERWGWLAEVIERWYAEPLAAQDGSNPDELATVPVRRWWTVGEVWHGEMPEVLKEWFLLVGNRLRDVQDSPATPEKLCGDDDGIGVWSKNQGSWTLLVGPDGECFLDDDSYGFPTVPLPTALHAMVLSDTLVGVWSAEEGWDPWAVEERNGPLGKIRDQVRGGIVEDDEPRQALSAAYTELPVPGNPYWRVAPRGDSETVLRGLDDDTMEIEWMTATDAAFARFDALVGREPGDEHTVVLAFEGLDPQERSSITTDGIPDTTHFVAAVDGLGRLGQSASSPDSVRYYVTTTSPDEVVPALRAAIPPHLLSHATIAIRPPGVGHFQTVFPDGPSAREGQSSAKQ